MQEKLRKYEEFDLDQLAKQSETNEVRRLKALNEELKVRLETVIATQNQITETKVQRLEQ